MEARSEATRRIPQETLLQFRNVDDPDGWLPPALGEWGQGRAVYDPTQERQLAVDSQAEAVQGTPWPPSNVVTRSGPVGNSREHLLRAWLTLSSLWTSSTSSGNTPRLNRAQWKNSLGVIASQLRFHGDHPPPPPRNARPPKKKRKLDESGTSEPNQAERQQLAVNELISNFREVTIDELATTRVRLPEFNLDDLRTQLPREVIRWTVWKMEALNFRHALLAMDQYCRYHLWEDEENTAEVSRHDEFAGDDEFSRDWETVDQRRVRLLEELSQLWGGESIFSIDPSREPAGLFSPDWRVRRDAMRRFDRYMAYWAHKSTPGMRRRPGDTEESYHDYERNLAKEFTRLFWLRFHRATPIPRERPPYPGFHSSSPSSFPPVEERNPLPNPSTFNNPPPAAGPVAVSDNPTSRMLQDLPDIGTSYHRTPLDQSQLFTGPDNDRLENDRNLALATHQLLNPEEPTPEESFHAFHGHEPRLTQPQEDEPQIDPYDDDEEFEDSEDERAAARRAVLQRQRRLVREGKRRAPG